MSRPFTPLYVFTFFSGFMPIYALFTLFILDHGMTAGELSISLAAWCVTSFVLEVPSGALADRTSRKKILVASQAFNAGAFALWAVEPNFLGIFIGFMLWGAKSALASGTYEAYVYDELVDHGGQETYVTLYGRLTTLRSVGALLAALSAAPLSKFGYGAVLWCSVSASIIAVCAALCMPEATRIKRSGKGDYLAMVRDSFGMLVKDRRVLVVACGLLTVNTLASMTGDLGPIIGRLSGLPQYGIGLFVALGYAMVALAGLTASRIATALDGRFDRLFPIAACTFILGAIVMRVPALVLVCLWIYGLGTLMQLYNNALQQQVASDIRATASSLIGLVGTALQVVLTLAVGAMAETWDYQAACMGFGATALLIGFSLIFASKNTQP